MVHSKLVTSVLMYPPARLINLRRDRLLSAQDPKTCRSLNSIKGTLSVTELLGSDALGWFTWTGGRVRVRLSIEAARALPRDVGLRVDIAKASFIFKENGRRL